MSEGFDKPLFIKINSSSTLLAIWAGSQVVAGLLLAWALPWTLALPGLAALAAVAWLEWRRPWPGRDVTGLWLLAGGACRLQWRDGRSQPASLAGAQINPWWVSLKLAPPHRPRWLVLCSDAVTPEDFRRLRARARWARWGG